MSLLPRSTMAAAAVLMAFSIATPAHARNFADENRADIERIIKEYLMAHPEVLQDAANELEKRQVAAEAKRQVVALRQNQDALFNSPHQVTLGNPRGDVTMVEFFDYNCPYCKSALPDLVQLLKADPKLKLVLKEYPVLGQGSVEAAQVSIAVRMQDKSGEKYLAFHQKLFGGRGPADKARALAAAKEAGLDVDRIEKDLGSDEVRETLKESLSLADAIGIDGTPSYIIGPDVVTGAQDFASFKQKVDAARR
jgi:protein-disulfide isomerase